MPTITAPQSSVLVWYLQHEMGVHNSQRIKCRLAPRVEGALRDKKLLQVVGHNYGPIYGLTDQGRELAATALAVFTAKKAA